MRSHPEVFQAEVSACRPRQAWRLLGALLILLASGCSSVDPSGHYERARRLVHGATGEDALFIPGERDRARKAVEDLLAGGLTSTEAVQVALLNNQQLQAQLLQIGLSHANVVQAGLLTNPSLQAVLRLPLDDATTNSEGGLLQSFTDLWLIPARKRVAETELEETVLSTAHQAAALAAEAKASYLAAVAATQSQLAAEENLATARRFLELSQARLDAGGATQVEVNVAHSRLLEQRVLERSARFEEVRTRLQLLAFLGLQGPPGAIELTDALRAPPELTLHANHLVAVAAENRLDLKSAARSLQAAESRVPLERRRAWPSLAAGVGYETEGGELTLGPAVRLTLPIFDQNQAQVAKAEMLYEQALHRLEGLAMQVDREVRAALAQYSLAQDTTYLYERELLPLREQSLELARESFAAGKTGFLYVLEAQNALLTARSEYVEQLGRLARTTPSLEAACGVPLAILVTPVD